MPQPVLVCLQHRRYERQDFSRLFKKCLARRVRRTAAYKIFLGNRHVFVVPGALTGRFFNGLV